MIRTERGALDALADALADTGKPLVATTGTGYLKDTGTALVDETFPVNAASPFAARAEMETRALQFAERGVRASVLRLPMCVYGRGGSSFVPMLLHAARENGASYWVEPGDSRQSTVHVDDLADLYLLALQNASAGSLYNAVLETGIVARDLAQAVAENTGLPLKPLAPAQAMPTLGPILTTVLTLNNNTSGAKAERELDWHKRTTTRFLEDIAHGSYRAYSLRSSSIAVSLSP
jgi:nucleoside-diphosphate-sugar epimerase